MDEHLSPTRKRSGQSVVEYVLILTLVALILIGTYSSLRQRSAAHVESVANQLEEVSP